MQRLHDRGKGVKRGFTGTGVRCGSCSDLALPSHLGPLTLPKTTNTHPNNRDAWTNRYPITQPKTNLPVTLVPKRIGQTVVNKTGVTA